MIDMGVFFGALRQKTPPPNFFFTAIPREPKKEGKELSTDGHAVWLVIFGRWQDCSKI
jgi:hypothetical protein